MSLSSHQSARMKNDEWLTPPWILASLGTFDLDPCAPVLRPWPTALHHFTVQDDGLSRPWHGRVWLNPPFGKESSKWLARLKDHGNGIALVAARTETRMFFDHVWGHASCICFLKSRPHFCRVDGTPAPFNSGAPICLIAYGDQNAPFLHSLTSGFCLDIDESKFA